MPGLIRGVARTAVIAGTATHVSNNVSRRQSAKWSHQNQPQQAPPPQAYYQQPPPPPSQYQQAPPVAPPPAPLVAPEPVEDVMTRIGKLAKLHDAGLITDEEFAGKKAQLLDEL